ncbi:MAG TPA: class I SAM-dependent methyltransferase, partial [Actinoplanes sp.]|nr:class I SAM-dependent methyltransferase [Actinoplanes sp.]
MNLRQLLTTRQAAAVAVVAPLGIAVAVAALTGRERLVDALLGVLLTATVLGLLLVRRRVGAAQAASKTILKEVRMVVEQTQQRLVNAIEQERLAGAERQQVLLAELSRAHRRTERALARQRDAQTAEIEALLQLFGGDPLRAPIPPAAGAMRPADLLALRRIIEARRPALVLEVGGGTSSVWLGYGLERCGGRLVCLDDDPASVARTRGLVAEHGLRHVVEVREAPLRPVTLDGTEHAWYDLAAIEDLTGIDLVVLGG